MGLELLHPLILGTTAERGGPTRSRPSPCVRASRSGADELGEALAGAAGAVQALQVGGLGFLEARVAERAGLLVRTHEARAAAAEHQQRRGAALERGLAAGVRRGATELGRAGAAMP